MKFYCLLMSILLLGCGQPEQSHDVRQADWGMTKKQVKESEALELFHEIEDELAYKIEILGFAGLLYYGFYDSTSTGGTKRLNTAVYALGNIRKFGYADSIMSKLSGESLIFDRFGHAIPKFLDIDKTMSEDGYRKIKKLLTDKHGGPVRDSDYQSEWLVSGKTAIRARYQMYDKYDFAEIYSPGGTTEEAFVTVWVWAANREEIKKITTEMKTDTF